MDATLLLDHRTEGSPDGARLARIRALLTLSGQAPPADSRPPLALALVLDRSGSMAGDRLEAAQRAAAQAVTRLHPVDVVSAVAFDNEVLEVAPPAPMAQQGAIAAQLLAIEPGGSTNLSGGWLRGRRHMEEAAALLGDAPGASRRIIVLTDGHANAGITDRESLCELARMARQHGIGTTTIGVGEGYDDDLLRAIADAGGGNAWYVERADQSQDVFAEELGNLLSVSAQGVTVTLALSPAVRETVVHSAWYATAPSAHTLQFDLGDLYASEPKPLLLEFVVDLDALGASASAFASDATTPADAVARVTVRADVLLPAGGMEARTMHLPIAASATAQDTLHPEIERAVVLAHAAKAREEAARRQREGDASGAADVMFHVSALMREHAEHADAASADEFAAQADDLSALGRLYESRQHSELDAKYQMQRSYNARRGKRSYDEKLTRRREP
jgi:Ca-activated chloride channel family protein